MFANSFRLFRLLGIEVGVHWTWLILAFLITSSLASGWFPSLVPNLSAGAYWGAGILGAFGLFASIVIHEFAHAVVGRYYKMPVDKITLFLFGGVAHLEDDPPTPKSEFLMAIAGPLASVALAIAFYGLFLLAIGFGSPPLIIAALSYLASINVVVAVFNMLPGFPLDGGRVLRSILWYFKGNMLWATKIASTIGQGFGVLLIGLGIWSLFGRGPAISGIWFILLGFLLTAFARSSYVQLLVKQGLQGKPAATFMDTAPRTVSPETPVSELMRGYINHEDQSVYPVVRENQEFMGCVDMEAARRLPEAEWTQHAVREITHKCTPDWQIEPEADTQAALAKMSKSGHRELLVVKGGRLLGVLRQSAILRYLTATQEQSGHHA